MSVKSNFEDAFRDRDHATGRLLLPLTMEMLHGRLPNLVFEIGQRLGGSVLPADVLVRAMIERAQLWGHAPHLFGDVKPEWGGPPNWPGINHEDAWIRFVAEAATVCANRWLHRAIGFDPRGGGPEEMLHRFWLWWEPREREVWRERDAELASRKRPSHPVNQLIYDVVLPNWRTDPPLDPHAVIAYRFARLPGFFRSDPEVIAKHLGQTVDNMARGVIDDQFVRARLDEAQRRTRADADEVQAALLRKLGEAPSVVADAVKAGKSPKGLFGPVTFDRQGRPKAHIDRDGLAGTDALCREVRRVLKADRSAVEIADADIETVRSEIEDVRAVSEPREVREEVRRLRESFEVTQDDAALAYIDWRSGKFGSRKAAAEAFKVTEKAIRHAEYRVAARLRELRVA